MSELILVINYILAEKKCYRFLWKIRNPLSQISALRFNLHFFFVFLLINEFMLSLSNQ